MTRLIPLALLCGALTFPAQLAAQDSGRTLHWENLEVAARLDSAGRLHVRERQTMVFTGDWNGGERIFNVRPGQNFDLHGITRIDASGVPHRLERGDLDAMDRYDFTSASSVRWRSRMPDDPPFKGERIVYDVEYSLSNILEPEGGSYVLSHDFAFPDRNGVIERYTLTLEAADVWRSASLPLRLERSNLVPGQSVDVAMTLQYSGSGYPAGVARGMALPLRAAIAAALVAALALMTSRFHRSERARGRFEPLLSPSQIDRAWLDTHIFSRPPEVVGAAWDNTTASPEVAAMIARLVQEGKLTSRVEKSGWSEVLHLELKIPKADLVAEERRLINALFSNDATTTDTERIRKRYSNSGFDPAALINDGIQKQVRALTPAAADGSAGSGVVTGVLVLLLIAVAITSLVFARGTSAIAAPATTAILGLLTLVKAGAYRSQVDRTRAAAIRMYILLGLSALPAILFVLGVFERGAALSLNPALPVGTATMRLSLALAALVMLIAVVALRAARTSESAGQLELRRTLTAGRSYFARELERETPSLEDAWFPWLIAFGLGRDVDRWFRSFGGESSHAGVAVGTAAGMSSSSGGWSGGGPLFGGGGGFGGGGAGRSWSTAVAGVSAGVSSPSSSSSGGGGGGGGGSSSGGGGGGGW